MRPTGVVRQLDALGRVVLPKTLRRQMALDEGVGLDIDVDGETIILSKHFPHCVFCGARADVRFIVSKMVCDRCKEELTAMHL